MTQGCDANARATNDADDACHWSHRCEHRTIEVRATTNRAGVRLHVRQCMRCGRSLGAVKRVGTVPELDERLRDRINAEAEAFHAARMRRHEDERSARVRERELRREQRRAEYQRYLAGPVWRRKRDLVLARCAGICEACGIQAATQVHHVAYPDTFGQEPLWNLRGVCRSCHLLVHGIAE